MLSRRSSACKRNGALKDLENAAKRLLLKAEEHEIQAQSPESFAQARQEILGLMNRLLALQDCLSRPDDQQSHHAMRIAAKRLRYTLEIIRPIYSGTLDATLEVIKQVQTLLGEVHDCDVWQEQLDLFGKKERDRIEVIPWACGDICPIERGHRIFAARSSPPPSTMLPGSRATVG